MSERRRILVIDDSPEDRLVIRRYLQQDRGTEWALEEATSGEEGLAACLRSQPDVTLLDLHLPGLDGPGVLRALQRARYEHPVVVLTGTASESRADEAMELGAFDLLVKGELTPTVLGRTLANVAIRARLQRRLEESARRASELVALANALSDADTPRKVIDILVGQGVHTAGAVAGCIALLTGDRKHLAIDGHRGYAAADIENWGLQPLDAALPISEAVRTGQLVTCLTRAERDARYPLVRDLEQTPSLKRAFAALPLRSGEGIQGVFGISFANEREFSDEDRAFLGLLGQVCGQALRRAQTQAGELRAREELAVLAEQRRLLDQAQSQLRQQAEQRAAELQAVLTNMPDAVFIGDLEGIHFLNEAAATIFGFAAASREDLPQTMRAFVDVRDAATGRPMQHEELGYARALREGAKTVMELRVRHLKEDREVIVRSASAPVIVQGEIIAAVTVSADITESKRQQEALKASADSEKHLIGIVSHDLKSPLQLILLQVGLMKSQPDLSELMRRGCRQIETATLQSSKLISDLLDFAQARNQGGFSIDPRSADLGEVVAQAIEALRAAYPGREIVVDRTGDLRGTWDSGRLDQLITNLVANALQHGDAKAPVLVTLREQRDRRVAIAVTNRGAPIPPEVVRHLFEPFGARQSGLGRGTYRNVGLGLFIVAQIVKAHGGFVEVRSTSEDGTHFVVQLPREAPSPSP